MSCLSAAPSLLPVSSSALNFPAFFVGGFYVSSNSPSCQCDDLWPAGPTNQHATFPEDESFESRRFKERNLKCGFLLLSKTKRKKKTKTKKPILILLINIYSLIFILFQQDCFILTWMRFLLLLFVLAVSLKCGYCCAMLSGFFYLFVLFNQFCLRCCSDSKRTKISRVTCVWLWVCSQGLLGGGSGCFGGGGAVD